VTTEDDLQALLDADPADHLTRLVLADFLQDRDDARAEGYRALGMLKRNPAVEGDDWRWSHSPAGPTWDFYRPIMATSLTSDWWHKCYDMSGKLHSYFPTRRAAEDCAALAFAALSADQKADILRPLTECVQ
jgi:uncharacterized protein (TIGR02996 family)